jgi:hypothetical protein
MQQRIVMLRANQVLVSRDAGREKAVLLTSVTVAIRGVICVMITNVRAAMQMANV